MLERFYCPAPSLEGRSVLEGDEARHLIRVRRVAVGELVELFDGRGGATQARVATIGKDRAELTIEAAAGPDRTPEFALTLATAVPKGDRFDWLVEKATELGVARLMPIVTERSVVDPRSAKLDRLRRAIVEASKQCRRNRLMELDPPTTWEALIEGSRSPIRLIAHPEGSALISVEWTGEPTGAIVAIGPEGGFSAREVGRAVDRGWQAVGLGPTFLRVETAALAACSAILARACWPGAGAMITESEANG